MSNPHDSTHEQLEPVPVDTLDEDDRQTLEIAMGHGEHGAHRTNRFYFAIFAWLAIVTVIELFITVVDHDAFRAFTLIVLSVGKFALVVMFFMHMKGDRPVYAMVFVGPLFLALVIGVSLVGLFENF